MTANSKSLKEEYFYKYWSFVGIHSIGLFSMLLLSEFSLESIISLSIKIKSLGLILFPVFATAVNGFLSSDIKEILVFWRFKNPLPGSRAFTKFGPKDHRVDMHRLSAIHGMLPIEPTEQNKLWYRIYKKHENKESVREAHRNFLMMRDISSFLLLLILTYLVSPLITNVIFEYTVCIFLCFEVLVTIVAARTYGNRFVRNVLAEESIIEPEKGIVISSVS